MYHKKNVDFAYLLWENFVYQVVHKDTKKSNEMYYPRFTKVIVNFFMTKDPSIPMGNKVNCHYVKDDHMFIMIKLISRHQNTQQFSAILPVELANESIKNYVAYKEYYAIASRAEPPKTKASVRKTQSNSDTTMPSLVAKGSRAQTSTKVDKLAKGKQPAKSFKSKGLTVLSEMALTKAEQMKLATKRSLTQTYISQASRFGADEGTGLIPGDDDDQDDEDDDQTNLDKDGDDFVHPKFSTHDEEAKDKESFDHIVQTPSHVENFDDEGNDDASHSMNVKGDEGLDANDDDNELNGDLNINKEGRDVQMTDVHTTQVLKDTYVTLTLVNPDGQQQSSSMSSQFVLNMLNPSPDVGIDSLFESTPRVDVPVMTTVEPLLLTAPTLPLPSIPIISQVQQALAPSPVTAPSTSLQDLLNFAVSFILCIVDRFIDHWMNEAIKVAVQLQFDKLQDEAQAENEYFLNKLDENIQKIIKEQVKEQVKVQVSKTLSNIEKTVNEQLEAKVLTRASNSSKTSYVVATDLSELELKKFLIEEMESNKSIHRLDQ
uniref:Retrovirus-related Pol polyprotein from transposon TNT 1-94 n=1 Tax=Tanacetum cinerariifolium TaxID=118510 RepID=A0A699J8Y3_TANCI|nr:hypothetical protein [Tanacetum cinerariifolium]